MRRKFLLGIGLLAFAAASAGSAVAADIAVRPMGPPPAMAPALPVVSWTGWYIGPNFGWVTSTNNDLNTVATPTPNALLGTAPGVSEGLAALSTTTLPVSHRSGFIGGGQFGYNWEFGTFVAGLETDIQGLTGLSSTGSVTTSAVVVGVPVISTQTGTTDTTWLGTVRGRIGFLATPTLLLYARAAWPMAA